jgi:DNA-binding GntR family transcriptional regulator
MSKASERAYRFIRTGILDGSIEAGSRLKEEELAERIGVSRTPIREALRQLLADGMAERLPGGIAIVVPEFSLTDLEDVFRLRGMLESHAAALAAQRITDEQLKTLQRLVADMERMVESRTKPDAYLDLNGEFHRTILDASGSRRLALLMPQVVELPIIARTFHAYDQAALERSNLHHAGLTTALAARDPDWAAAVMRSHIASAWRSWRDGHAAMKTTAVGERDDPSAHRKGDGDDETDPF